MADEVAQAEVAERETHNIPEVNFSSLVAKFAEIARKAQKLGVSAPTLKVIREYTITREERDEHGQANTVTIRMLTVSVDGESPKLAGYHFVARLEHHEAGTIVRVSPDETLPEVYRSKPQWCDHCKSNRMRKDTFVVKSDAGEYVQVGRQCLKDFLGGAEPKNILAWYSMLADAVESVRSGGSDWSDRSIYLTTFLNYVAEAVIRFGWVSRKKVSQWCDEHPEPVKGEKMPIASVSRACDSIRSKGRERELLAESGELLVPSEDAKKLAQESVQRVLSWKDKESLSDYESNLLILAQDKTIEWRDSSLAGSMVGGLVVDRQRAEWAKLKDERDAQYAMQRASSNEIAQKAGHIGTVGEKLVLKLCVVFTKQINTQYGMTILTKLKSEAGNVVVWFTKQELVKGQTYNIMATIKEHSQYDGVPETIIGRGKLVEDGATVKPKPIQKPCGYCNGTGKSMMSHFHPDGICTYCGGSGKHTRKKRVVEQKCDDCGGTGEVADDNCVDIRMKPCPKCEERKRLASLATPIA